MSHMIALQQIACSNLICFHFYGLKAMGKISYKANKENPWQRERERSKTTFGKGKSFTFEKRKYYATPLAKGKAKAKAKNKGSPLTKAWKARKARMP